MSHLDDLAGLDVHFRKAARPAVVIAAGRPSGRGIVALFRGVIGRVAPGGRDESTAPETADPAPCCIAAAPPVNRIG